MTPAAGGVGWWQVVILDALAVYGGGGAVDEGREAEGIIERVTPRLQHVNAAVVLSAVKVPAGLHRCLTSVWPVFGQHSDT
jgi:AP-1 complex subunit beta-1